MSTLAPVSFSILRTVVPPLPMMMPTVCLGQSKVSSAREALCSSIRRWILSVASATLASFPRMWITQGSYLLSTSILVCVSLSIVRRFCPSMPATSRRMSKGHSTEVSVRGPPLCSMSFFTNSSALSTLSLSPETRIRQGSQSWRI